MSTQALTYWNDSTQRHAPEDVAYVFTITGTTAASPIGANPQVLLGWASADMSQSAIDAVLGSTNEVLSTEFGSTAMGTDAIGIVANFGGQAQLLVGVEATYAGVQTTAVGAASSTTLGNTLGTKCRITSAGNFAAQIVLTGVDSATAGLIKVKFYFKSK